MQRHRAAVPVVFAAWLVVWAGGASPALAASVTVVATGDVACDAAHPAFNAGSGTATECRQRATSDVALALQPRAALLLGDLQYENGSLARFLASFDASWGRLKPISHPAVGNHEYITPGAAGYFDYFGDAAGPRNRGYYSFDLGGWHLVALNSNCAMVGGCGPGSPQLAWLADDLASQRGACTLAYWHHPRFSSASTHGSDAAYRDFWETLQEAGSDLVLVGHDHTYERFGPQDADGVEDRLEGIREFVVGLGGRSYYTFAAPEPNSERRVTGGFGVLALTLYPNGYLWRFVTTTGAIADQGGALCRRAVPGPLAELHPLPFCRAVSTRRADAPAVRTARDFRLAGRCGVPADAVAVLARLTALASTSRGAVTVFPAEGVPPDQPSLGFLRGRAVSTDLLLPLGPDGEITVEPDLLLPSASVHVLLDVVGYFR